jgi:hypothetical protein
LYGNEALFLGEVLIKWEKNEEPIGEEGARLVG